MRLQKSLGGQAKEAVVSMLIYPNNVPNVLEELEFRFGRPDMLVKVQLQKICQIVPITEAKLDQIVAFATKVRNIVACLNSANCKHHLCNPTVLEQLVLKLSVNKQLEWSRHAASIDPYPTLVDFSKWLSELTRYVSLMPSSAKPAATTPSQHPHPQRRFMYVNEDASKIESNCLHCAKHHFIANCNIFKSLPVPERWNSVKRLSLCFCCLIKGHNTFNCRNKKPCNINGCRRNHHQMLHDESECQPASAIRQPSYIMTQSANANATAILPPAYSNAILPPANSNAMLPPVNAMIKPNAQSILNCHLPNSSQLFEVIPIKLHGPRGSIEIFAMFDDGSSISILDESIAKQLGLKGNLQPLQL